MNNGDPRNAISTQSRTVDRLWLSVRWWLLGIAILNPVVYRCAFGFANPDFAQQVSAAQSFLDGYGLTVPTINTADLSAPVRTQLLAWPPGYSLVVACALYATGNLWIAVLSIHIIAVTLLYGAWFLILELLSTQVTGKAKLLLWVFWALSGYPIKLLSETEIVAFAMFSWAIVSCLYATGGRRVLLHACLAGLCLAGACAFRYAYWPLVIVLPLSIFVASTWSGHHRRQLLAGLVCGLVSCSLLALLIFSQRLRTGQAAAFVGTNLPPPSALHWNNLLRFCPVPAAMFGLQWEWEWLWRKVPALQSIPRAVITWSFSSLLLIATALQGRRFALKLAGNRNCQFLRTFLLIGGITAIVTIGMLCFLSVRDARQTFCVEEWTFVEEARYHAPYGVFLLVAFVCVFAEKEGANQSVACAGFRRLAIVLMMGCALFVFAGRARDFAGYAIDYKGWRTEGPVASVHTVYAAVRKRIEGGKAVLFLRPDRDGLDPSESTFQEMGGATSMSLRSAAQARLASQGPVAILVVVPNADDSATLSLAERIVERKAVFRPIARVRHGQLYEAILPSLEYDGSPASLHRPNPAKSEI